MSPPRVYLDTSVLKFSATQLPRLRPRNQKINWGGRVHEIAVHDSVCINPNSSIKNPDLKAEAELLPKVAEAGKRGRVMCVIQTETLIESWGLPKMDSTTGRFYGAPYQTVEAPITYSRVVFGGPSDFRVLQFDFLAKLKSQRFVELQRVTGAYQGDRGLNRNQLLDAFHLWCAEHNRCDYFLTLDFKLIRMLRSRQSSVRVRVVRPSELLVAITGSQ